MACVSLKTERIGGCLGVSGIAASSFGQGSDSSKYVETIQDNTTSKSHRKPGNEVPSASACTVCKSLEP